MKPTFFPLVVLLLTAVFCTAQSAPKPEASAVDSSSEQPGDATQAPEQAPPPAKPPTGQTSQPTEQTQSKDTTKGSDATATAPGTSKDRLFFALPNFLSVENGGKVEPLTAGQKFKVVAQGTFDPIQIAWYGALSGISQASNSEPGFGQGWAAYGKRFGAYAADGTIENFFVGAIVPSVLHQDPRFFPTTQGSFFHRASYAVSRIAITRTDSGQRQFNFSEVFGSAMASAISTYSYHPRRTFLGERSDGSLKFSDSDRTLQNTASVWGTQMGYDTITLVVKEFWPDIRRKLKKQP